MLAPRSPAQSPRVAKNFVVEHAHDDKENVENANTSFTFAPSALKPQDPLLRSADKYVI